MWSDKGAAAVPYHFFLGPWGIVSVLCEKWLMATGLPIATPLVSEVQQEECIAFQFYAYVMFRCYTAQHTKLSKKLRLFSLSSMRSIDLSQISDSN